MPRVTPTEHYKRYQFLHATWSDFPQLYSVLSPRSQWQLHELYRPVEVLTHDELAAHIRKLLGTRPGLVNQAGKYLRVLEAGLGKQLSTSERGLTVRSGVQPEPSLARAARVLVEIAKQRK